MPYPASLDSFPHVTTNTTIASTPQNNLIDGVNNIEGAVGTSVNWTGFSTLGAAVANKLDKTAGGTMGAAINMGANPINNCADPTSAQDVATKNYTDNAVQSLAWHAAVRAASTANVAGTYVATGGVSGHGQFTAMPNTLDGVTLAANDRVLLKNQTTGAQNGIWVVTTPGTGSNGTWDRATDFDDQNDAVNGVTVVVIQGTVNITTVWGLSTLAPYTIGGSSGSALTFIPFPTVVLDANGNTLLAFSSAASSVNYVRITNAASANAPTIAADGTGTNLNLNINTRSGGQVLINGLSSRTHSLRKAAAQTVNNSTTLVNDNDLQLSVNANEVWAFRFMLVYTDSSGSTPGLKVAIAAPTGSSVEVSVMGLDGSGTLSMREISGSGTTWVHQTVTTNRAVVLQATVAVGSTAGTVNLQWAQNTANASNTQLLANSHMLADQVA